VKKGEKKQTPDPDRVENVPNPRLAIALLHLLSILI